MKIATPDPFRGYGNAIHDELDDAVAVLNAFKVVKLGLQALEETRRHVQQTRLGHRGRKHDPLYQIGYALALMRRTSPIARSPEPTPASKPATPAEVTNA